MNTLTVGIIGAGRIGKVHANTILTQLPHIKIKYIADTWAGAKKYVESLNGLHFTQNIDDIFNDKEIEAVLICSSTDTHVEYIIKAANAKKHIFCEKPVDHDLNRIILAKEAVELNGVKFQIGFNRRFDHNFLAVKKAIDTHQIGDVRFINITSRDPEAPPIEYVKVSGGMFMDMTIHDFDMARFLAGSEVKEVYAKGVVMVDKAIGDAGDIDSAAIILTFENGSIGIINNCREASYGYDQRVEVFGSKGSVEIKNDTISSAIISTKNGVVAEKPLHFFMQRYTQSYKDEMIQFIESIQNNTETKTNIIDGLKSVEIAKAAVLSYKENRVVKL
ncbi:MAG: inositol 2-dehydrogenase [Fusobacteria bacterium]|nr:inositol 2-dehydrogenase [Fusobacteriota bacterium]